MGLAKQLGHLAGSVCSMPYHIGHVVDRAVMGGDRGFILASERIAKRSGQLGVYMRQAFYKRTLAAVGDDVHFGFMSLFSKRKATLGDRVYIGRFCTIGLAEIGDDVMLADSVQILSGRHQHGSEAADGETLKDNEQSFSKVTIGKGAWLGAGCVIMADVGAGAIVAAGAVVVKPVPDGAKVGGVPAKPLS